MGSQIRFYHDIRGRSYNVGKGAEKPFSRSGGRREMKLAGWQKGLASAAMASRKSTSALYFGKRSRKIYTTLLAISREEEEVATT